MVKKISKKSTLSKELLLKPGFMTAKLDEFKKIYRNSDSRLKSRDLLNRLYRYYHFGRRAKFSLKLAKLLAEENELDKGTPLSSAMVLVAVDTIEYKKLSK